MYFTVCLLKDHQENVIGYITVFCDILPQIYLLSSTPQGGRTDGPKANSRTDISPNRHMAERHATERTYGRKTSDRKDILPKGITAEKYGETDFWPKRRLTQNTHE